MLRMCIALVVVFIPCAYFGTFPDGRPNCTNAAWRCEGPLSCAGPTRYQACALGLDTVISSDHRHHRAIDTGRVVALP